jgi:hypothetical protein
MPTPATWDDMATTSWDSFYTWDDPMRDVRLDQAYAAGTVTRDSPQVSVAWTEAGDVVDGLDPVVTRDTFYRPASVNTTLNTNPFFEVSSVGWQGLNGATLVVNANFAHEGVSSMVIVPDGVTGFPDCQTDPAFIIPVLGGREHTVSVWTRPNGAGTRQYGVIWFDASFSVIGSSYVIADDPVSVWTYHEKVVQAPALAVWAKLDTYAPFTPAVGNSWRVDEFKLIGPPAAAAGWQSTMVPAPGYTWTTNSVYFTTDGTVGICTPNLLNSLYTAMLLGMPSASDFDVMIKVRARQLFTGASGSLFLLARWQDNLNHLRFRLDFNIDQVIGWGIEARVAGLVVSGLSGLAIGPWHRPDEWLWLRAQGQGSTLRLKIWSDNDLQPDEWNATKTEDLYSTSAGPVGVGFRLTTGNTNALTYNRFEVDRFFSGVNDVLDSNRVSTSLSLDDGMPSGATNTGALGVPEATGGLGAPIGVSPEVFWSTFRTDQPYNDLDRDIAGVGISSSVVSSDGIRQVRMFTGQMADVSTVNRSAELKAISRTRLRLSTRVQPPAVHGFYEGAEATWAIQFALFKSGLRVTPPLLPGCRVYIPLSGSTRAFIPEENSGAFATGFVSWTSSGTSGFRGESSWIDGPFPGTAAPDLCVNEADTRSLNTLQSNWRFADGDPWLTKTNYVGRIEYWVKGDYTNRAASFDSGGGYLVRVFINSSTTSQIEIGLIVDANRGIKATLGDTVSSFIFGKGTFLPADGKWHYIAMAYDMSTSMLQIYLDGQVEIVSTVSVGVLSVSNLPSVDVINQGYIGAELPIADIRMTSGVYASPLKTPWTDQVPFTQDVVMRRSTLDLASVAEPEPREAYELISSYAQAELAKVGFDAQDRFLYLPMSYWAEPDQQAVAEALSTDNNMGVDFNPARVLNRTYNQVVVTYKDSSVQELFVPVFQTSELITIPHGVDTLVTVPLSPNPIETRGLSITVMSGATLAATPPNPYSALNYVTANSKTDGTGTYATSANLVATIVSWNPGSATVRFRNTSGMTMWTVNDVSLPPFGLAGKALTSVDATVTAEDRLSVIQRGTRMLPASLPAIQNRNDAIRVAQELVARLARPRVTFTSSVFGDPRRAPGSVVSVSDPYQTQVNGLFRITRVATSQDGPDIQQSVTGEQHWPVAVWGQTNWGEGIWGP